MTKEFQVMEKFRTYKEDGKLSVEVNDLGFLYEREGYGWFRRHFLSVRCRHACRKAERVVVHSEKLAAEVVRYYFIPKDKIVILPQPQQHS